MDTHTLTRNNRAGSPLLIGIGTFVLAAAAVASLALLGWWWLVPLVGTAAAVIGRSGRIAVVEAFAAGLAGYALALFAGASASTVGRVARVAASLAGLGNDSGLVVVIATVVHGSLLCLVGAWVTSIVLRMYRDRDRDRDWVRPDRGTSIGTSRSEVGDTDRDAVPPALEEETPPTRHDTPVPTFAAAGAAPVPMERSHE